MTDQKIESLWVSLEEEKPRNGQYCIVWIDRAWQGHSSSSATRAHWSDAEGRFDLQRGKIGGDPTHWMPWPKAPSGWSVAAIEQAGGGK